MVLKQIQKQGRRPVFKQGTLEQTQPNDVIQITCATVSSQAVINGVNAAIGTYRD